MPFIVSSVISILLFFCPLFWVLFIDLFLCWLILSSLVYCVLLNPSVGPCFSSINITREVVGNAVSQGPSQNQWIRNFLFQQNHAFQGFQQKPWEPKDILQVVTTINIKFWKVLVWLILAHSVRENKKNPIYLSRKAS